MGMDDAYLFSAASASVQCSETNFSRKLHLIFMVKHKLFLICVKIVLITNYKECRHTGLPYSF